MASMPATASLDVLDFGADPTGASDSTAAIQAALDAASGAGGGTVVFPPGTYLLASYNPSRATGTSRALLTFGGTSGPAPALRLLGHGATLTTPLCVDDPATIVTTLRLQGDLSAAEVVGLTFLNTHATTPGDTCALAASGGTGDGIRGLRVEGCTFRNHSRSVTLTGCVSPHVSGNTFLYDAGRDSGSTTPAHPNVAIWSFCNASGRTSGLVIRDNDFDGCVRGLGPQQVAADGLVFGTSLGWTVVGNRVRHHGYEAIYLSPRTQDGQDPGVLYPAVVAHNAIDSTPYPGSSGLTSYAIRCDESGVVLSGNVITGATRGILVYGADTHYGPGGIRVTDLTIAGNQVSLRGAPAPTDYGVYLSQVDRALCAHNTVTWPSCVPVGPSATGFRLQSVAGSSFRGNAVRALSRTGGPPLYGFSFHARCTDVTLDGDVVAGADCALYMVDPSSVEVREASSRGVTQTLGCTGQPLGSPAADAGSYYLTGLTLHRHAVTFTPASGATGWYRVAARFGGFWGRLTLRGDYDNARTDVVIEVDYACYGGGGQITPVRYLRYNGGVVDQVRVVEDASHRALVEIHVSKAAAPGPVTCTLESNDTPGMILLDPPAFGPGQGAGTGPVVLVLGTGLMASAAATPRPSGIAPDGNQSRTSWS